MAIKKPDIDIAFKQKATSSINKSERGIAILILKNDETSGCPSYAVYKEITEYELQGTLTTGTSTITVVPIENNSITTTFDVTVA